MFAVFLSGKHKRLTGLQSKSDEARITETVKLSVDETPIELCFWDIRGIDYDPSWLRGAHVALVCFSVNIGSTDSKGKHLGRVSPFAALSLSPSLDRFFPHVADDDARLSLFSLYSGSPKSTATAAAQPFSLSASSPTFASTQNRSRSLGAAAKPSWPRSRASSFAKTLARRATWSARRARARACPPCWKRRRASRCRWLVVVVARLGARGGRGAPGTAARCRGSASSLGWGRETGTGEGVLACV